MTPPLSGPICGHSVVTAAPVAIHVRRLVATVTVHPLRARACIGTYCIWIIDQTVHSDVYNHKIWLGDIHVSYNVLFVLPTGVQRKGESDYTIERLRLS